MSQGALFGLAATVTIPPGPDGWRAPLRRLLAAEVPPRDVRLVDARDGQVALGGEAVLDEGRGAPVTAPRRFFELARRVACHADPDRYDLLYRLAWRLTHGEPRLLEDRADPDVARLRRLDAAVRRDAHKTKAFVRFRKMEDGGFAAWHGAEHDVLRLVGPFFADRFSDMRWVIFTPRESASFDGGRLRFGEGVARAAAGERGVPSDDALDEMWRAYYRSIFNPARVNPKAMRTEMPVKHWRTLPEAALIPELIRGAPARAREMVEHGRGADDVRLAAAAAGSLDALADAVRDCRACALCRSATQAVAGEGAAAPIALVGEQPGDEEDLAGRPFVGPAGEVLAGAMAAAGLAREAVYLTNAVKHFRFRREGKRQLHQRPTVEHVRTCRPWLIAELELARPRVVVCLGVTATRAVLGQTTRMDAVRGRVIASDLAPRVLPTWHPAAVLRASDPGERASIEQGLRETLRRAGALAAAS